jgi:hypothetical protein
MSQTQHISIPVVGNSANMHRINGVRLTAVPDKFLPFKIALLEGESKAS